jgi:diguanylate cyclase (GGDEF)-like protein
MNRIAEQNDDAPVTLTEELLHALREMDRRTGWDVGLGVAVVAAMAGMVVTAVVHARNFDINVSAPAPTFFAALGLMLLLAWLVLDHTRKGYLAHFSSLLQQGRIREQRERAIRDPLTGVYNRAALEEFGERSVRHAARLTAPLTMAVFDLDGFHNLNSKYGHIAGDLALTQFAQILQGSTRGSDFVARYGGDEFVALLPDTDAAGVQHVLKRITERVGARNTSAAAGDIPLAFTAGTAQVRQGMSLLELFGEADHDLLRRKEQSKAARPGARL